MNKNIEQFSGTTNESEFYAAIEVMPLSEAQEAVSGALRCFEAADAAEAEARAAALLRDFPDQAAPDSYWHDAASTAFKNFFTWGHDHDFGQGISRSGAMGKRHIEIVSESVARGFLPANLSGQRVLDIGCWSGGDVLILAGLGAKVTAIEEHPKSAASARKLLALSGCDAEVIEQSLYQDRQEWAGTFDVVYCSGVIYHVTDPLLFLRICFAYLRPGGRLIIETKSDSGEGSQCSYSGTMVKGWNWYAPNWNALGRWLVDAGFGAADIALYQRPVGRLLAGARKTAPCALPEPAGFSRPGSWLEGVV